MFIRRLDNIQASKENRAKRAGGSIDNPIYGDNKAEQLLRWRWFTNQDPATMFATVRDDVFPWLRGLRGEDSTYAHHMRDARFTIPTANLLTKVVDLLDDIPLTERDTAGDLYEYMLSKIATAGQNGQFRTPRHIIQLMVAMTAPGPRTRSATQPAGQRASSWRRLGSSAGTHENALLDSAQREHFNKSMFHGFDFDNTMLRIASMNMLLHEVEHPDIRYRDSLAESAAGEAERYSLILANPPFAGSLDYETTAKDLQADRQDQEDRAALPGAFPPACSSPAAEQRSSCQRACSSAPARPTGKSAASW